MTLRFLGTGTSQGVPVIGCECEVCRSADPRDNRLRSSVQWEVAGKTLVVDTGPDFRQQMLTAGTMTLDAVLFTHEHRDHTAGLDDTRPFYFRQRKAISIYATERVQARLKEEFSYAFATQKYPGVPDFDLHTIDEQPFEVEGIAVTPLPVLHYKLPVLGFRIGDMAYITDANFISEATYELLKGVKVLVLNALQIEPHISHFTLAEAIEVATRVGAEQTYFTHISHLLGTHQGVEANLPTGVHLAYDGLTVEG